MVALSYRAKERVLGRSGQQSVSPPSEVSFHATMRLARDKKRTPARFHWSGF